MHRGVNGRGNSRPATPPPPQAPIVAPASISVRDAGPLGSVNIDSLSGDALKRYAARAGVRRHDIDFLTEDRLRQNVKLTIAYHFELIAEG